MDTIDPLKDHVDDTRDTLDLMQGELELLVDKAEQAFPEPLPDEGHPDRIKGIMARSALSHAKAYVEKSEAALRQARNLLESATADGAEPPPEAQA